MSDLDLGLAMLSRDPPQRHTWPDPDQWDRVQDRWFGDRDFARAVLIAHVARTGATLPPSFRAEQPS